MFAGWGEGTACLAYGKTSCWNPAVQSAVPSAQLVSFEKLLQISDYISVHTDLNPSTHHLFDAAAFGVMK